MRRSSLLVLCFAALATAPAAASAGVEVARERVQDDVYHWTFTVTVGSTPNARLVIHRVVRERAPFWPRPTTTAILLNHGDFKDFTGSFMPRRAAVPIDQQGLAEWLAARDIDVWGLDRRWATTAADGDVSDYGSMGLLQEVDDMRAALAFARGIRLVTDGKVDKIHLSGFSRGGQLAYYAASIDAAQPAALRQVKGLVPLDVYAAVGPDNEDARQFFCASAGFEYEAHDAGVIDFPNSFQIDVGTLERTAPLEQTPYQDFFPGFTNHRVFNAFMGRTYIFFAPSPSYHLAGPFIDGGPITGFRFSDPAALARFAEGAVPHQSSLEQAETDAMLCNESPPFDIPLSRIRVPLLVVAADGGYGRYAEYATTQVGSSDVTFMNIDLLPGDEEQDFGHVDLLLGADAPALAWQPLLDWLRAHR